MRRSLDLPTWQILSDAGGQFRWSPAAGDPDLRPEDPSETLVRGDSCLPSMADLVRQAPSKLLEGGGGIGGPMFRTGLGGSVLVKESSIQKARSVLEGRDVNDRDDGSNGGLPMFHTGSGKSVTVRQSSIKKAAAVLGGGILEEGATGVVDGGSDGFPMFQTGSGKSVTVRQSSIKKAAAIFGGEIPMKGAMAVVDDSGSDGFPMFHTGSGKSVMVTKSSMRKAAAILQGEVLEKELLKPLQCGSNNIGAPMFQTGSGKSVSLKQSSIRKAVSILQDGENMARDKLRKFSANGNCNFSNSFQFGSGKSVNSSSSGLSRATDLLGLEGNCNLSTSKCFDHAIDQADTNTGANSENLQDKSGLDLHLGTGATLDIEHVNDQSARSDSLVYSRNFHSSGYQSCKNAPQNLMGPEVSDSAHPPIKFHTAGGRSMSISSDALKRARSLLGDLELGPLQYDVKADHLIKDEEILNEISWNKENTSFACLHQNTGQSSHLSKILPPVPTFTNPLKSFLLSGTASKGDMLNQVNANGFLCEDIRQPSSHMSCLQEHSKTSLCGAQSALNNSRMLSEFHPIGGPLVEISNNICANVMNGPAGEKKRSRRRSSISPFKRPRTSRFTAPVNRNSSLSILTSDSTKLSISENCCCRTRVSTHYPLKFKKKTLEDFFGGPPTNHYVLRQLPDKVQRMSVDDAKMYRFCDSSGSDVIGPEALQNMLIQSGALLSRATNEWVANHYKWIVWKLACLERCYPTQASGKLLTASNVLEELKYRYEREVNHGHRSAIKKILDGDAFPASMMVLCISSTCSYSIPENDKLDDTSGMFEDVKMPSRSDGTGGSHATKIELTDGWYSLDAILDVMLSKQLKAGKLFVGQKLRIWGAGLCGWVGPTTPLEASKSASLLIHINGTYRAPWSSPLGFCKGLGAPLAFRCIKGAGGKVPRTLVGVTRIYPVLYKERFPDGGSIVRSERMERKACQLFSQRRSNIVEDIMAEQHDICINANDSEEGARIFRILETSAEPEVLMADMNSDQLISFSTYQTKQEAIRQSCIQKKIEKALEDAGLSSRDVTSFMKVKVVGLTSKGSRRKGHPKEGLITIWNPTEKQKLDLVEGQPYSVTGLMPLNSGSDMLRLQARGPSTEWRLLHSVFENFELFFTPRTPVLLSNLGEVPLASEFDIAAVIVHVGDVYISGCQKKQWVFVTDGSRFGSKLQLEELHDCLLAVSFCSPINDYDSSVLPSHCLSGTTVCFCNLIKRARDQTNHVWVAEATENSTYSVCYNFPKGFHLKEVADSAKKWAKVSCPIIQKLKERVLCVIGDNGI